MQRINDSAGTHNTTGTACSLLFFPPQFSRASPSKADTCKACKATEGTRMSTSNSSGCSLMKTSQPGRKKKGGEGGGDVMEETESAAVGRERGDTWPLHIVA